jgi:DNA-binding LacI/PurR family transcriptional regulator
VQGTPIGIFDFPAVPGQQPASRNYTPDLVAAAKDLGYSPKIYSFPSETSGTSLAQELYHRNVQGLVIVGSLNEEVLGADFPWDDFSVVQCARFSVPQQFHMVRSNIFQSMKMVFNKLCERGYRRIGFALGRHPVLLEDDEARYGAAISLQRNYLAKRDQLPIYQGEIDDAAALLAWVEKCRPDAVVGFSPAYYWLLKDAGYAIPADIGFVTLHHHGENPISGLDQNMRQIARQSVLLLDQLVLSHERGKVEAPMHMLIPSTWYEGETLRPALQ